MIAKLEHWVEIKGFWDMDLDGVASLHLIRMGGFVSLRHHPYSSFLLKAFTTNRIAIGCAFLILACLQEQALDAARIKKACHFVTGFVIRIGFEPMTYCLEGSCSIQLSYRTRSFQLEVQNKDNLALIQRKRALNQSVAIKSLITTLAAVQPNIAGM